ncbi:hypothetical protein HD806DRAFT_366864 [Xylariaceae sp. AK1471]|nr:hypothetical protein HD806DRAFT_366864 [Xylariaceae sp. AK1471]
MMRTDSLSFMLLVALPVSSSGVTLDNFDPLPRQDLNSETQVATGNLNVFNTENRNERRPLGKDGLLTKPSYPMPTAASTVEVSVLSRHIYVRDVQGLALPGLGGIGDKDPQDMCGMISFSVSKDISSSVSASVSGNDASVLSATLQALSSSSSVAVRSARDAGILEGRNQASGSVRSTIDAPTASASSTVGDSNNGLGGGADGVTKGLNLNAGKLAGIVVAVFFASSISSILATIFILRYRRQRAGVTHTTLDSPIRSIRHTSQPIFGNLRGNNALSSKHAATATTGHRELPKEFTQKQGMILPTKNYPAISSADRLQFAFSVSPGSISNQIYPISPLSDQPSDNSGRDGSPGFEISGVPPIKLSLAKNPVDGGAQRAHVVQLGARETTLHHVLLNARTGQTSPLNDKPGPRTAAGEEPDEQETTNRIEGGTAVLMPTAKTSAFSTPVVPLRFSSLNAYKSPPTQNFIGSHWDDEAFISAMDDGTTGHDRQFFQNPLENRFPVKPSYAYLTDLQTGTADQQPVSRFSVSPTPLTSIENSASSSPPVPHYHIQQLEQPEISPLRPAPPSPSQLQSPIPRRPKLAAIVASMETATRRTPKDPTPTPF